MMHMTIQQIIFYIFAGLTVLSAVMVITQSNPVRCVLFLVFCFFTSSVLWLLLQAEFLALILVLVYVGAVMTLFLFVVMMLNIDTESIKGHVLRWLPIGLIMSAALVGLLYIALPTVGIFGNEPIVHNVQMAADTAAVALSDTQAIGMILYTDYFLAFELAAVLLLVAIIAAVTLAHRPPRPSKRQSILNQLMVRRDDRVTLVTMKSEHNKE